VLLFAAGNPTWLTSLRQTLFNVLKTWNWIKPSAISLVSGLYCTNHIVVSEICYTRHTTPNGYYMSTIYKCKLVRFVSPRTHDRKDRIVPCSRLKFKGFMMGETCTRLSPLDLPQSSVFTEVRCDRFPHVIFRCGREQWWSLVIVVVCTFKTLHFSEYHLRVLHFIIQEYKHVFVADTCNWKATMVRTKSYCCHLGCFIWHLILFNSNFKELYIFNNTQHTHF
jgi:hypothetical protein